MLLGLRRSACAALAACALLAGCASSGRPRPDGGVGGEDEPRPATVEIDPAELATQRLFRVRYEGPQGSGGLRLVLRLATLERFSLAASDTLGRPVWTLGVGGGETVIVDHRQEETCVTRGDVRVPEAALAPLPIEWLPVVLLGRLPVTPGAGDGEIDVRDARGRRWTARMERGRPRAWTLWSGDEPSLWWLAQPGGGVLSHRSGSQFRWRESVVEPLETGREALEPPAEYPRVECDEWGLAELRQDQPAPAGDRPAE